MASSKLKETGKVKAPLATAILACNLLSGEIRAFWQPLESENSSSNFELWAIS